MRYRRRVQVVGGSTYTISLPKEWVKNLNLQHGSELVLEVVPDSSLRIYPSEEAHPNDLWEEELEIDKDFTEISFIKLIASYVVGYDRIVITCANCSVTELEEFSRQATEKTIGLEITEKDRKTIVLQCLANISTLAFSEVLRTLVKLTLKSFEDVEKFLEGDKTIEIHEILDRDNLIDKLYLYGLRQLNQVLLGRINCYAIGLKTIAHTMYLAMMLKFLERIADHLSNLAEGLVRLNVSASNMLHELITCVKSLQIKYVQITNLMLGYGLKELDSLSVLTSELRKLESSVIKDPTLSEYEGSIHLVRISAYLRDLIELLIDTYELDKLVSSSST